MIAITFVSAVDFVGCPYGFETWKRVFLENRYKLSASDIPIHVIGKCIPAHADLRAPGRGVHTWSLSVR